MSVASKNITLELNAVAEQEVEETVDRMPSQVERHKLRRQSISDLFGEKIQLLTHIDDWEASSRKHFFSHASQITIGLFAWGAAVFCFGFDWMLPDGPIWACFILWLTAMIFGKCFDSVGIPPLLGQLIAGIVLKNFPGTPVEGMEESWAGKIRAIGLCLILMRSGLEIDVAAVLKQGWVAARLTVLPGVSEALAVAGAGMLIFGMPFTLAISMGFILAAVSPAIVVGGMFDLQKRGLGVDRGIPSLVVAAASMDDVVAISGFSMFIGMAIPTGEDPILAGMHGPINVFAGVLLGVIGGMLCGCTRLWNKPYKRTYILLSVGLFYMMVADYLHFGGGGALAGLTMSVVATHCWRTGCMGESLSLPANDDWNHAVEHDVAAIWVNLAQPLLFASIGATIFIPDLISGGYIGKAILVILIGVVVRTPMACASTLGREFELKERVFIGLAWIPKATVQAALASKPLEMVEEYMKDHEKFHEYENWGKAILATAVLAILITAPIGLVSISSLGPRWLVQAAPDARANNEEDKEESKWALREENKRMMANDQITVANRLGAAFYFRQMQDEIENLYEAANHPERYTGSKADVKFSARKLMNGVLSAHRVINKLEDQFPVKDLFDMESESYGQHYRSDEKGQRRSWVEAQFPTVIDNDIVRSPSIVTKRTNSFSDAHMMIHQA